MGEAWFGNITKHASQAGVRRVIVGLIELAIGSILHVVEEGVRVDCDKRVRAVHRHVCASERMMLSTTTTSLKLFFEVHVFTRQILCLSGKLELTLSYTDNIKNHCVQVSACTVNAFTLEM